MREAVAESVIVKPSTPDLFGPIIRRGDSIVPPPDRAAAEAARDEAIARAANHADRTSADWTTRAFQVFIDFARSNREFQTLHVRMFAEAGGLIQDAPDARAWGAVTIRAVKAGVVVCDRYEKQRYTRSHARPAVVWRSLIFKGQL